MKNLYVLVLGAFIIFGLQGCEKAKVVNNASADVFVKSTLNAQGTIVYAAVHSVFSYNTMSSVSVKSPAGTSMQLIDPQNNGNSFYNEPADAEYSATPPLVGAYTYAVKYKDGEELSYTNSLSSTTLAPAHITSLTKSANGDSVYIYWGAIATTDAYQLKVIKGTTQVLYQPAFADASVPQKPSLRYGFPVSVLNSSGAGTFTFIINGLLFETTDYIYLQAVSVATKDITL